MLELLFSSKTRLKLLSLFLLNPDTPFFVRELTRRLDERINSIRRELAKLQKLGLIKPLSKGHKKYYSVDKQFKLYDELRALILKAGVTPQNRLKRQIQVLPGLKLGILSGVFTQQRVPKVDILLVGKLSTQKVSKIILGLEKDMNKNLRYAVITEEEYRYRVNMNDLFLTDILDNDHVKIIDKIGVNSKPKQKAV